MAERVRIFVVGLGRMGAAHAIAYHRNPGFEIVGLMSRAIDRSSLPFALQHYPTFTDFRQGMDATRPDAVSINSYPDTHAAYAIAAMEAGAHVFLEKPIATTVADAERVVATAVRTRRKLVLGYILRVHPLWTRFIELGRTLGKPLVMRFSLNQQSSGESWQVHRNLLGSIGPLADVGVHYVDVMCQLTGARPVRVHGIGATLWPGAPRDNYGHLHVTFDDGSIGWFESGWGPMISETAFFVRDIAGPGGSVSIVGASEDSGGRGADVELHAGTDRIRVHHAALDGNGAFVRPDDFLTLPEEPGFQELCEREQALFLKAIVEDIDLTASMAAAVDSLRVVLAAEASAASCEVVTLPA